LRSLLSILGLVIGVASLVAILALADGMEQYARDQIETTTDFQRIGIAPRTVEHVDGVALQRNPVEVPTAEDAASLTDRLRGRAVVSLAQRRPSEITLEATHTAATLYAADAEFWSLAKIALDHGRPFTAADVESAVSVVVLSNVLASRLVNGGRSASLIGSKIGVGEIQATVVGILSGTRADLLRSMGHTPHFRYKRISRHQASCFTPFELRMYRLSSTM
jgi:ABC-type lipoprotein release transport system permease subunit